MSDQSRNDNDAIRLRERAELIRDDQQQRRLLAAFGSPSLVAQTTAISAYPTSAQRFYGCQPQTVLGREVEGGPGTLTTGPGTFLALNVGSAIPPVGTTVLTTFVESRWVFRYDG